MEKNKIIQKYINLIIESEKFFLNDVPKYNNITKKIWKLQDEILLLENSGEIYKEILKQTNYEKYWQMHYDIAGSMYLKDKEFALEIYRKYKGRAIADSRIEELEKELKKEKKGLFGKLF